MMNDNAPAVDLGVVRERQRARQALDHHEIGTPEFGLQIATPHIGNRVSFHRGPCPTASLLAEDGWELIEVKSCHHVGMTPEAAVFQVVVVCRRGDES